MQILRLGGLFQPNQTEPLVAELVEYWRQRAVDLDFDRVGPVTGNFPVKPSLPRTDDSSDSAATCRPHDPRQIDVTAKRRANYQ